MVIQRVGKSKAARKDQLNRQELVTGVTPMDPWNNPPTHCPYFLLVKSPFVLVNQGSPRVLLASMPLNPNVGWNHHHPSFIDCLT